MDRHANSTRHGTCSVAAAALGSLGGGQSARSFLHTSGVNEGSGVFTTWHHQDLGLLADYAAWLVYQHWVNTGQTNRAEVLARYAWVAGGRDPRLVAAHAQRVASSGSAQRLAEATGICNETLLACGGSTDPGWGELRAVRNRLAGQLARRALRPSGEVDDDGNPIPVRRHHPEQPERTRHRRFALD